MKTTKTYYIACECKTGYVSAPPGLSTNAVEVCPVCNGSKIKPVIEVTETTEPEETELKSGYVKTEGCDKATGFVRICKESELKEVAHQIFKDHPGTDGYYNFTKFLWVTYPDGRPERRLDEIMENSTETIEQTSESENYSGKIKMNWFVYQNREVVRLIKIGRHWAHVKDTEGNSMFVPIRYLVPIYHSPCNKKP